MNFTINYNDLDDPSVKNKSVAFLELFLNYHLCLKFHGWTYDGLTIYILNNPSPFQKYKSKITMQYYASVELPGEFYDNRSLNLHDFLAGFSVIERAVKMVDDIPVKGTKDYRVDFLLEDMKSLRKMLPETEDNLLDLYKKRIEMESMLQVRRADGFLMAWKENPGEKTRKLIGIRIFGVPMDPYTFMYAEVVGNLLQREKIFTPGYIEIYIAIGNTLDKAKATSPLALRDWHKYTYASLDIELYNIASEEEKDKMVLKSIANGLRLIADVDHLDKEKIERVINRAESGGPMQELLYGSKENKTYRAEVFYKMEPLVKNGVPFYLQVTEKASGHTKRTLIDKLFPIFAPYSIGKIAFTKDEVVIKGRPSSTAEISRSIQQLPDQYVFNIADLLK